MTIFRPNLIHTPDEAFIHHRDCEGKGDIRRFVDFLVHETREFCGDENIEQRFQESFHSFTWQFYLGYLLKTAGAELSKASSEGPDHILSNGTIIEAVLCTRGEGENRTFAVTDMEPEEVQPGFKIYPAVSREFPDPKVILRITSSIRDKLIQYRKWREANVVSDRSTYIIGVNALLLEDAVSSPEYSYGARVCFGLGPTQMSIPVRTHKDQKIDKSNITTSIRFDSHIKKHNGQNILSSLFFDDEYRDISAIAFSAHYIGNVLHDPGRDVEIILNPYAKNPIKINDYKTFKRTYVVFSEDKSSFTVHKLERGE